MAEAGNLLHCGAVVIGPARFAALNLGQIKRLHWHRCPDTGEALRKRSLKKEKGDGEKGRLSGSLLSCSISTFSNVLH